MQQVTDAETALILELAESVIKNHIDGDLVELGCYKGDTSLLFEKLVEQYSGYELWIYDSFMGLPEKSAEDASVAGDNFKAGELFVPKREVVDRFRRANLKIPHIKKAFFDELTNEDLPAKISFAFLDGDLYGSIKTSLKLVTPRMQKGGIVIVHDYNNPELPGSARAVDEWKKSHPDITQRTVHSLAILQF